MFEIVFTKKFKSSFKRVQHSGNFKEANFDEIISFMERGIEIPVKYRDHALTGNLFGKRECHVSSDLLLVYETDEQEKFIKLLNIGNHAQVFNS